MSVQQREFYKIHNQVYLGSLNRTLVVGRRSFLLNGIAKIRFESPWLSRQLTLNSRRGFPSIQNQSSRFLDWFDGRPRGRLGMVRQNRASIFELAKRRAKRRQRKLCSYVQFRRHLE